MGFTFPILNFCAGLERKFLIKNNIEKLCKGLFIRGLELEETTKSNRNFLQTAKSGNDVK